MKVFARASRRALLRSAAGAALSLPLLESLFGRQARAQVVAPPKRLVIMYTSNGTVLKNWTPSQLGANFPISTILDPLDTPVLRPKLSVLSGVEMAVASNTSGNGHAVGMTHLLTCRPFKDLIRDDRFGDRGWGGGISIDQEIARQLQVPSIQLGVNTQRQYNGNYYTILSYREGGGSVNALASEDDPRNVFNQLFSNLAETPDASAAQQRAIDQRKSVLDLVAQDFASLQGKLGRADQARLEQHATLLRELEGRLGVGPYCSKPMAPEIDDVQNSDNFPSVCRAQIDLLGAAFACDLARVATLQLGPAQGDTSFRSTINDSGTHHMTSHSAADSGASSPSDSQLSAMDKLTRLNVWHAQQLAYLGEKLSLIDDGDGCG
jgi:hypothetical protein